MALKVRDFLNGLPGKGTKVKCHICGKDRYDRIYNADDGKTYVIASCKKCGYTEDNCGDAEMPKSYGY